VTIDDGAKGIVEMLFCTSLIALVGAAADQPQSSPRKLQIVNTKVSGLHPSYYHARAYFLCSVEKDVHGLRPHDVLSACCSAFIPLVLMLSIMPVMSAEAIYYMRTVVSILDLSSQAESQNAGRSARGRNLHI
jgi:hypothetical protein